MTLPLKNTLAALAFSVIAALGLGACGSAGNSNGIAAGVVPGKTFSICIGPDMQKNALIAFFDAREGDTIQFCEGTFNFTTGLIMTGKRGITLQGAGMKKTVLNFKNSDSQDGVNLNRMTGITVQGLTVEDAPGNGLRIFRSDIVTIRDVKVSWSVADPESPNYDASMASWVKDGAYAFYPVLCHKVLIEDSLSIGSSDAGVYVGQSSDILVRRTEALHNVAGFEFENTYRAEFIDNIAHDNVAGFLIFDLPGRGQFGEKNLVHHNVSYNNNIPSFAPRGAIVGDVPSGTGMLVLDSDQLEVYDNDVHDNNTTGLVIVNYGLVDPRESSTRYDFFPEGMHIYNNTFTNNGGSPQPPDNARNGCKGDPRLPAGIPSSGDLNTFPDCLSNNASLLPTILVAKNGGKSAQIIWDGAEDKPNDCTKIPTDIAGVPLTLPNLAETGRYEARSDERGRPNLYIFDPTPSCKYNAWKFDAQKKLKKPENGLCIEGNKFVKTTPQAMFVDDFSNIHFGTPDPTAPENLGPVDHNMPNDCPVVVPALLPQFVPVLGSFTPNPANDPRPDDTQLAQICGAVQTGQVNMPAVLGYNCPRLDQYGLFKDATEPRKNPNGFGVPFDLNTILFSDYAVKYRFLFLPPDAAGNVQKATFLDHNNCDYINIYDCKTATLGFPVGTVFAKTFAFRNGANEDVVETRLLIKRQNVSGSVYWVGLPFEWTTDASGLRVAVLKIEGDAKSVKWDYDDEDPQVKDSTGKPQHYTGAADKYGIPNAGACLFCHSGDDREAGTAPIGPKVRNLNKTHSYPGMADMNQLTYLKNQGLLDLPDDPSKLEKMPKWNVPGSTGEVAGSGADIHKRARSYLEVNCMHCHNSAGAAQNSGLSLDAIEALDNKKMDEGHGICKPPIAAGRAADVGNYDIQPGNSAQSVLNSRVASTSVGIKMPPVARTQMHAEFVTLLNQWVDSVVTNFADPAANSCGSSTGFLPIGMMAPAVP